jgi:5-oxoprolinase (ATP-hydrolysing) subunit A
MMTTSHRININVDMGESFGNYSFGSDAELMEVVPTANVACGFHAGDPHVMRQTVAMALEHGVEIGAHVGLPDLIGFGRRWLEVSAEELGDYTLFQVGALDAFVRAAGGHMSHVKPHGVLYRACGERSDYAEVLIEAVANIDSKLRVIVGGDAAIDAGRARGVRATNEGYVDLDYRGDGYPVIEQRKLPRDPDEVAERAVRLATKGRAPARDTGEELTLDVPTLCLHGDTPNAVEIAHTVCDALAAADVQLVGLAEAMDSADAASAIS